MVEGRLISNAQRLHGHRTRHVLPVHVDAVLVGGKHGVKGRRQMHKVIKKRPIVLVPEYRGYALLSGKLQQVKNGARLAQSQPTGLASQFVTPCSVGTMKRRFHKNQIRLPLGKHVTIVGGGQAAYRAFSGKANGREVIGNKRNFELAEGPPRRHALGHVRVVVHPGAQFSNRRTNHIKRSFIGAAVSAEGEDCGLGEDASPSVFRLRDKASSTLSVASVSNPPNIEATKSFQLRWVTA